MSSSHDTVLVIDSSEDGALLRVVQQSLGESGEALLARQLDVAIALARERALSRVVVELNADTLQHFDWARLGRAFPNGTIAVAPARLQEEAIINAASSVHLAAIVKRPLNDDALRLALRQVHNAIARDPITGAHNHSHAQERIEEEIVRARRYGLPLSLVLANVDFFERFNEEHGHRAGDGILRRVARILIEGIPDSYPGFHLREADLVARYGGDDFLLVLPETSKQGALVMAERMRAWVEAEAFCGEHVLPRSRLTVSVGVASCPEDAHERSALLDCAHVALHNAKLTGRNRVHGFGAGAG